MPVKAIIISIGDEILYGQTLDSNAHWISNELNGIGIQIIKRYTIADREDEILTTLAEAENKSDIVLITGGLGPTNDDLTKPCLVNYFNTTLVRHPDILQHLQQLFALKDRAMTPLNEAQADLPANCTPIKNTLGTAPGMWFQQEGKLFVSMPGVPHEMRNMMSKSILPKIKEEYVKSGIYHKIIRTIGIAESKLAQLIAEWETDLPSTVKLAYLPTTGTVKLRLTIGDDSEEAKALVAAEVQKVLPLIEKYVYGFDDEELEEAMGRILSAKGKTLAIAESCTGGYLAHRITSVAGSSSWFAGGIVPYSNNIKNKHLNVPMDTLEMHGAVSQQVVEIMASNVRKEFDSDIGVAISGIAGPSGGTKEKPVGTVWIAYADEDKVASKRFQFLDDRLLNIKYTSTAALNMIRIYLNKK